MNDRIKEMLQEAISKLQATGDLPENIETEITVERCRNPKDGDYTTNIALKLTSELNRK